MKTVTVQADISAAHELRVVLPTDVPTGRRTIVLVSDEQESPAPSGPSPRTLGDFLDSEFFGMWADRDDTGDSAVFARELREEVSRRQA